MKNKILVSINDFPIFKDYEYAFSEIKKTGADGIEVIYGIKSKWPFRNTKKLSQKYNLPVFSVHQPLWSGFGLPDFSFIRFAKSLNVEKIVIHPLAKTSLSDKRMKKYFEKMAKLSSDHNLTMLLENLPVSNQAPFIDKLFPGHKDTFDPLKILETAKKYGFKMTLDTSHFENLNLGKWPHLKTILSDTENIHLSSFSLNRAHLPLHLGDFNYKDFFVALKKHDYKGFITLEIYYPKMIPLKNYDYPSIKKSIEIIKQELSI